MVTIDNCPLAARQFADWSMGFANLDAATAAAPLCYGPFVDSALTDPAFAQALDRCRQMLQIFRQIE